MFFQDNGGRHPGKGFQNFGKDETPMEIFEKKRERQVVEEVSSEQLWKHAAFIAQEDRLSGSEGETRAVQYFKETMDGYGLDVEILEIENYISLPIRASITVLSPATKELPCITHSFSVSTSPHAIDAEVVYVPRGRDADVKGKIVLSEGLAAPYSCWAWEEKGAVGLLWINAGELPRNMIITTVWGQPTPETAKFIPRIAVASMNQVNGEYLKSLCQKGKVQIRLLTETWTGFKKVPLAIANIQGKVEAEKYVLFNGHIDSWHKGASDNATANACMLETARIIAKYKSELRRGVRFVWWSGHSHGRYSGSNWYADYHWEDLYRNAVANLNVDSLGCRGATDYSEADCSAELYEVGRSVLEDYTGQSPRYSRIGRSGDQSFWGIGIPALFQLLSRQAHGGDASQVLVPGLPWFWHTEADTIDKIDPNILLKDTRVYMAALWRLSTSPVLPLSFTDVAAEFIRYLLDIQQKAGEAFDLSSALKKAYTFQAKAGELQKMCRKAAENYSFLGQGTSGDKLESKIHVLNRCLMKLSRTLMPVNYSAVDRFEADRAMPIPPFPRLQQAGEMEKMNRNDASFKFLERKMVRERNRVCYALTEAGEMIDQTLQEARVDGLAL